VRIDRASGKRVFGTFPTKEDPKSPVIWEAFQPQTEPRRSFRRGQGRSEEDEEAEGEDGNVAKTVKVVRRTRAAPRRAAPAAQPAPTNPLPTQPPTQ
jgi:penicillin-binding protein 1A